MFLFNKRLRATVDDRLGTFFYTDLLILETEKKEGGRRCVVSFRSLLTFFFLVVNENERGVQNSCREIKYSRLVHICVLVIVIFSQNATLANYLLRCIRFHLFLLLCRAASWEGVYLRWRLELRCSEVSLTLRWSLLLHLSLLDCAKPNKKSIPSLPLPAWLCQAWQGCVHFWAYLFTVGSTCWFHIKSVIQHHPCAVVCAITSQKHMLYSFDV